MRLPNDKQRIAIVGRTGSGKTLAALWHLEHAGFVRQPWIILDYKGDPSIAMISRAKDIELPNVPREPGIYIARPHPDDPRVAQMLERIWQRGNTGLYIDEGYMVSQSPDADPWFRALLTQGRSKHIPMIVLAQRPVWLNRFVFSESDFFQVFDLNHEKDRDTVESFVPPKSYIKLPEYHSLYYDVGKNKVEYIAPVPDAVTTTAKIDEKLRQLRLANLRRI